MGGLQSSSLTSTIGAQFVNNTGSTITELSIAYRGEMWRLGTANRNDRLDFQYSTNATALNNGTWTDADALDFTTPDSTGTVGARNGNSATYFTNISHTITGLNISDGASFWIRWQDFNASGADDGLAVDDFSLTPGNTPSTNACGDPFTAIYAVQGSGMTSPLVSTAVVTEGVVTGLFNGTGQFSGFFIQDLAGDGDPATSDGIFVFDNNNLLPSATAIGDRVRVSGTVVEFTSSGIQETQLSSLTQALNCGAAAAITPIQVTLPLASSTFLERYEGMLISLPQTLYVTEVFNLARFGEVWLSSGSRLFQPTQIATPGAAALAQQAANNLNRILLDDGRSVQNPDPVIYPFPELSAANTLRVGYTAQNVTGILGQRFGEYRIQPTTTITFSTSANPRSVTPPPINTNGTPNAVVASFNVLNYFNGDGLGGGFPTSRGASNLTEFNRQRAKTIAAITALGADVVGLMEMENDGMGATSALQDLLNGLNAAEGPNTWAAITEPITPLGTDEIRVAIIYKPA
ncbi:MAG: ExeM/NucH family extracellular endonuclease, partial [Aggregatilineales bacterium]